MSAKSTVATIIALISITAFPAYAAKGKHLQDAYAQSTIRTLHRLPVVGRRFTSPQDYGPDICHSPDVNCTNDITN
jgi:hypothetical protein